MVEPDQIAPHVEDISRVLGSKVDKKEIERMLMNYIEIYKISVDDAKRAIVKHYGGSIGGLSKSSGEQKKLNALEGTEQSVDLLVRLVAVSPKQVTVKGQQRVIHTGILADETGTRPFTAWTSEFPFEKGDVLTIRNAYCRAFKEAPDVQMGDRVRITKEDDSALPPFKELGGTYKVSDIHESMTNVAVVVRVLEIERREVEVEGLKKVVFSGIVADATGKVNFTAWSDFSIKVGQVLHIGNAYVKGWRGIPQLTFDDKSHVDVLSDKDFPTMKALSANVDVRIGDLLERGGAMGALIKGVIIDIKPGSGLVLRCPKCNRVIQKGACSIHGKVEGEHDLRIKAVLDDGTGALTAIINRELTEKLLGKDLEAAKKDAMKAMSPDVIFDELREKLMIETVKATGRVTSDDFGLMLLVDDIEPYEPELEKDAKALLEELETTQGGDE
jgi:replication factor A1